MKILLFGDNSSLHSNLRDGLIALGHKVVLASDGDGWKNIPRDIDINYGDKFINRKIANRIFPWLEIKKFTDFDIVQIISPDVLHRKFFPGKLFFQILKKHNKKVFLLGAGSDWYFWRYGRQRLRYGPFEDTLKYDLKSGKHPSESYSYKKLNQFIAESVDGIIPVMYEYEISYQGHKNLLKTIPIPINTEKITYKKNIFKDKIVVFHGLSRYGFKGTRYIEKAFDLLRDKYPNDLELIIDGKIPLKKYLPLIKKTNIIIDQTNTYSTGLSGLYAMAMGKVTLGGAEPESLNSINIKKSPCINIKPNEENIFETIEKLILNKDKISEKGFESRKYIEEVHGHIKIAHEYLNVWGN